MEHRIAYMYAAATRQPLTPPFPMSCPALPCATYGFQELDQVRSPDHVDLGRYYLQCDRRQFICISSRVSPSSTNPEHASKSPSIRPSRSPCLAFLPINQPTNLVSSLPGGAPVIRSHLISSHPIPSPVRQGLLLPELSRGPCHA